MPPKTFIIDCPLCKAKVAAIESGRAERTGWIEETDMPFGERLYVGNCPSCKSLLAGESVQQDFENFDSDADRWSDVVRVHPKPPKTFFSHRIPRVLKDSLMEADRSMQSNANIAACLMFGRALEALCRNILNSLDTQNSKKEIMLGEGIKKLRELGIIDERLHNWSSQLRAFRNIAAHAEDISISREDAEDLQTFVYAIVEYIYDLTDRYEEFKSRAEKRKKKKKKNEQSEIFPGDLI